MLLREAVQAGQQTLGRGLSAVTGATKPVAREHPASLLLSIAHGSAAGAADNRGCWLWRVVRVCRRRRREMYSPPSTSASGVRSSGQQSDRGDVAECRDSADRDRVAQTELRGSAGCHQRGKGIVGGMMWEWCCFCKSQEGGGGFCFALRSLAEDNQIKIKFPRTCAKESKYKWRPRCRIMPYVALVRSFYVYVSWHESTTTKCTKGNIMRSIIIISRIHDHRCSSWIS